MAHKIYSRSVRFLGNENTTEVHDLNNEKTGANECQINEILAARSRGRIPARHSRTGEQRRIRQLRALYRRFHAVVPSIVAA